MDTVAFLRHVLPATGPYVVCREIKPKIYQQFAEATIDETAQRALSLEQGKYGIFFAVGALLEGPTWDEEQQKFGKVSRVFKNIRALRSYIIDIDVGPGPKKQYPTYEDAAASLKAFCQKTQLPRPTVVKSGGGLHVYFTLDTEVPAAEWRSYGELIKKIAAAEGFKYDGARTADAASVLRVAGTHNYKYDPAPEVEVWFTGTPTPTAAFHKLLEIRTGSIGLIGTAPTGFGSNTTLHEPSILEFEKALHNCQQFRNSSLVEAQAAGDIPEPIWVIGVHLTTQMKDGRKAAHFISKHDPRYNAEYVDQTFDRFAAFGTVPRCDAYQKYQADKGLPNGCIGCPSYGKITSPAQICRLHEEAPPLIVTEVDEEGNVVEREFSPPALPKDYRRLPAGMAIHMANPKTGANDDYVFCEYDMYPVKLSYNERTMLEDDVEWAVKLPKEGWIRVRIPQGTPQNQLKSTLARRGLYVNSPNIQLMDTFMTAYMRKLQTDLSREKALSKYGWREDGSFALGNMLYLPDGSTENHGASRELIEATHNGIACAGTYDDWKHGISTYNRGRMEDYRSYVYSTFSSILFSFTGQTATFVSASGITGTGKSTLLDGCASVWGNPQLLVLSGGKQGYTRTGAEICTDALHNIPLFLDEITKRDPEEMQDFIFNYSGGRGKVRGKAGGGLRTDTASWANIALCNGNTNEYDRMAALSNDNLHDMVRLVQITFSPTGAVTKDEGDEMRLLFRNNYGWAGIEFVKYVTPRLQLIKDRLIKYQQEIGATVHAESRERFWVAWVAANKLAGEIAVHLNILPKFPIAHDVRWMTALIDTLRSNTQGHIKTATEMLSEFLDTINNNTLILSANAGNINNIIQPPRGELQARHEADTGLITFNTTALRSYCFKQGINHTRMLGDLRKEGVLIGEGVLRTLGAQTPYARGQVRCFIVDQKKLGTTLKLVPQPSITTLAKP